ncbi:MAG TPA: threonine synthase [Trueperaceae bacterium]|nr:threonine synthase [Trueperaceae bacterium]
MSISGFVSTRSRDQGPISFSDAMLAGLAPDGGLYVPTGLPTISEAWLTASSPAEVAAHVLPALLGMSADDTHEVFSRALDFAMPVVGLTGSRYLLELFHGPTAAFKDVGARVMAQLLDRALTKTGRRATVLVATSGDTGGAVADAFAGLDNVKVAVLFPRDGVSAVQEQQLVARRRGVTAFAVAGSFDDCQRLVKGAFGDPDLMAMGLSTANSINVARLLPQTIYYFWAAKQLREVSGALPVTAIVPSGNLGNLTAGVLAARMGAPYTTLVAAHNSNDYFARFISGSAAAYDFGPSVPTVSNAMDVGAPSNFERLHGLLAAGDEPAIAAFAVDDDATIDRMRRTYADDGYLPCPHTAVGLEVVDRWRASRAAGARPATGPGSRPDPVLVLATAHPAKFPAAVRRALVSEVPEHPGLAALADAERAVVAIPAEQAALKDALLSLAAR